MRPNALTLEGTYSVIGEERVLQDDDTGTDWHRAGQLAAQPVDLRDVGNALDSGRTQRIRKGRSRTAERQAPPWTSGQRVSLGSVAVNGTRRPWRSQRAQEDWPPAAPRIGLPPPADDNDPLTMKMGHPTRLGYPTRMGYPTAPPVDDPFGTRAASTAIDEPAVDEPFAGPAEYLTAPPVDDPFAAPPASSAPPLGPAARPAGGWAAEVDGLERPGKARPTFMRSAGLDPAVRKVLLGLTLIAAYVAICVAPLAVVNIGYDAPRRPFLINFSVALAYVGLMMMMLQFTLVSRIKWLAAPFGIDILHRFHKEISFTALAFILAHPGLLLVQAASQYLYLLEWPIAPWRARFAVLSLGALFLVVLVSVWRRKLRVSYEVWKITHGVLSTAVIYLGLAHMVGVSKFTSGVGGEAVVGVTGVVVGGVLVWSRLIAPRFHLFRPWRVVEMIRERGNAITVVVRPEGHKGWSFMPGQFAWVTVNGSPFRVTHQHPFSISSPGDIEPGGHLALTIKELGDWTQRVGAIEPGSRIHLDGPYGSFSMDVNQAPGYVFIAGGVGITPLYSMIATMCLREDTRPVTLFYANSDWESVTFREQLEEVAMYMPNLRLVHVLKNPPEGWTGETGRITADVLLRHLPRQYRSFDCFICAGEAMMDACEEALVEIGVPDYQIHTERFNVV